MLNHDPIEFEKDVVRAHWQLLESCISKQRNAKEQLQIDPIEEIYYNFGVWCGEQLAHDFEVLEAKASYSKISESEFYHHVFETLAEELLAFKPKAPFITITHWLKQRDETYQLLADMERFKIPKEVLAQLPENAQGYLKTRAARLKTLEQLSSKIKVIPGLHLKLQELILSGNLHDRIDMLKMQNFMSGSDKNSLDKMINIWKGVEKQMIAIFKDQSTLDAIAKVHQFSDEITIVAKANNINFDEVFDSARALFLNDGNSYRRLLRDVQMLRNNLNISAIKSKLTHHNPCPTIWPKPINLGMLETFLQKTLHLDKSFNSESELLLAPGKFHGFYEFDKSTFVFPICSEDAELEWVMALVQFRFSIETLKNESTFIKDLEQLAPNVNPQHTFQKIYRAWLNHGNKIGFFDHPKIEQSFLLKHVAPSLQTLFLRDEEFYIDAYKKDKVIEKWQTGHIKTIDLKKVAGILFSENKLKECAQLLIKLSEHQPNKAEIELPLIKVLLELGQKESALKLLKKYLDDKNFGFYQIYAQNILAKLKSKASSP